MYVYVFIYVNLFVQMCVCVCVCVCLYEKWIHKPGTTRVKQIQFRYNNQIDQSDVNVCYFEQVTHLYCFNIKNNITVFQFISKLT